MTASTSFDSTEWPPPAVPVSAVVAYRIGAPWVDGTNEARQWWRKVDRVLERRYCGNTLAAYLDGSLPAICLDLDCGGASWKVLYLVTQEDIADAIAGALETITERAGVDPALVERVDLASGPWGDDMTQVLLT